MVSQGGLHWLANTALHNTSYSQYEGWGFPHTREHKTAEYNQYSSTDNAMLKDNTAKIELL